ncbi:hypothetical protein FKM82_020452 [Ascaphus truei]
MPNPSTRETTNCSVHAVLATDCPIYLPNNGVPYHHNLSLYLSILSPLSAGGTIPLAARGMSPPALPFLPQHSQYLHSTWQIYWDVSAQKRPASPYCPCVPF